MSLGRGHRAGNHGRLRRDVCIDDHDPLAARRAASSGKSPEAADVAKRTRRLAHRTNAAVNEPRGIQDLGGPVRRATVDHKNFREHRPLQTNALETQSNPRRLVASRNDDRDRLRKARVGPRLDRRKSATAAGKSSAEDEQRDDLRNQHYNERY